MSSWEEVWRTKQKKSYTCMLMEERSADNWVVNHIDRNWMDTKEGWKEKIIDSNRKSIPWGSERAWCVFTWYVEFVFIFSKQKVFKQFERKAKFKNPNKASYVLCFSADLIKEQFTLACSLNVYKRECFMGIRVLHSPSRLWLLTDSLENKILLYLKN